MIPEEKIEDLELMIDVKRKLIRARELDTLRLTDEARQLRRRMLIAEAALEHVLATLDNPHDHAYAEIEAWVREWEKSKSVITEGAEL